MKLHGFRSFFGYRTNKKIDTVQGELILIKSKDYSYLTLLINLHDITDIRGDLLDYVDDY